MIIKKFQGKTKEEALESARKELGDNIVEMNTKNVKSKGLLGIFKGTRVEVTVAKEEDNDNSTVKAEGVKVSLSQGKGISQDNTFAENDLESDVRAVADALAAFAPQQKPPVSKREWQTDKENIGSSGENLKGIGIEKKLDTLQNLIERQLSKQQEIRMSMDENKFEEDGYDDEETERVGFLRLLYNKMIDNEVSEKYANEIIDEIDRNCKADVTMDYMLSEIYQRMILKFGKPYMVEENNDGLRVVFFVGPTGVGKTTTIAKIASNFHIEHKKKVALLTADTYRIAAAEQLRTYANILEVPFRVVYTAEEITSAAEDYRDYDYILVDTTGHSPNNEAQCEGVSELISSVHTTTKKEVFLVVSASTKYRDLMKIADTYKEIADYKLIFTKLDETTALGNIYNLKMHTGAPLSYVTCGQNVPDDIEYFNPQATVKQLLGGRR